MRSLLTALVALVALTSCASSGTPGGNAAAPLGPSTIQYEIVRQHARQFDVDVPDRPPGSQHEVAAASYILGHLQLAGFSPRLDRVPVADTINSTNVFAYPPNGSEPEFLVAVSYDTPASGRVQQGTEIGLFLELARALTVADPDHEVGFVGLGAQTADARGTRRLAQFLLDEGMDPSIILIRPESGTGRSIFVRGACGGASSGSVFSDSFTPGTCRDNVSVDTWLYGAGFQLTTVGGDVQEAGRALFDFLTDDES